MTKSKFPIAMVVAALKPEMGIGYQGKMPWRLRKEIKYFKDVTTSASNINAVVMGRKTWDSIPQKFRPLPDRLNIVLSRTYKNTKDETAGVWYYNSFDKFLEDLTESSINVNKVFVIGGAQLYNELITDSRVEHLLITEIESIGETPSMDTFLNWDLSGFVKEDQNSLSNFIDNEAIVLPKEDIVEGDFKYNYTYWKRRNKE